MNRTRVIVISAAFIPVCTFLLLAHSAESTAIQPIYADLVSKTGTGYISARDTLLQMDNVTIRAFLRERQRTVTDPIESLLTDALLARANDPARVDRALAKAFHATMHPSPKTSVFRAADWNGGGDRVADIHSLS